VVFEWRRLAGAIGFEDAGVFGGEDGLGGVAPGNRSGVLDGFNGWKLLLGMSDNIWVDPSVLSSLLATAVTSKVGNQWCRRTSCGRAVGAAIVQRLCLAIMLR
jgi:hypothetical protein